MSTLERCAKATGVYLDKNATERAVNYTLLILLITLVAGVSGAFYYDEYGPGSTKWYYKHNTKRNAQLVKCKADPVELVYTKDCQNALLANDIHIYKMQQAHEAEEQRLRDADKLTKTPILPERTAAKEGQS
jgi:hypothetical protein